MTEGTGQLRIKGGRELRRTMKQAGADLKDLSALNKAAAQVVAPKAKAGSPVGPADNGHISNTVRVGATQRAGIIRVGNARLPYAGKVHYGTPDGAVSPNPWVTNAAHESEPQWTEVYWAGLMKILDNIKGAPSEH